MKTKLLSVLAMATVLGVLSCKKAQVESEPSTIVREREEPNLVIPSAAYAGEQKRENTNNQPFRCDNIEQFC